MNYRRTTTINSASNSLNGASAVLLAIVYIGQETPSEHMGSEHKLGRLQLDVGELEPEPYMRAESSPPASE